MIQACIPARTTRETAPVGATTPAILVVIAPAIPGVIAPATLGVIAPEILVVTAPEILAACIRRAREDRGVIIRGTAARRRIRGALAVPTRIIRGCIPPSRRVLR